MAEVPDLVTLHHAALLAGVSTPTLRAALRRRELPVQWIGGRRFCRRLDVERWAAARRLARPGPERRGRPRRALVLTAGPEESHE